MSFRQPVTSIGQWIWASTGRTKNQWDEAVTFDYSSTLPKKVYVNTVRSRFVDAAPGSQPVLTSDGQRSHFLED